MSSHLLRRVVVITGASGGLGRELALQLSLQEKAGHDLCCQCDYSGCRATARLHPRRRTRFAYLVAMIGDEEKMEFSSDVSTMTQH